MHACCRRQRHSGEQTVCNQQQPSYASRVLQSQSTNTMEMHETTCASTHSTGSMFRPAHVAHVLATESALGGSNPPYIIPHVGTNIPPVSGHVIHAMRDTILVVYCYQSHVQQAHPNMMKHIECSRQSTGIITNTTHVPIERLARGCHPSHTSSSLIQQVMLAIETDQLQSLVTPMS